MIRAVALATMLAVPAAAQEVPARIDRAAPSFAAPAPAPGPALFPAARAVAKPWVRPVLSALVPGSGQLLGGQPRGIVYLAVEALLVSRAVAAGQRGRTERAQYRALAYDVARRGFSSLRIDGPFEYYETMEKFVESGNYDLDPGAGFTPETDTTTFNGFTWALARRTFFANPDSAPDPASVAWNSAIAFYASRAVGPNFRWSWRGARLEQDVFRGAIRASDDAFRERTNLMGALVLNHLASAIDALISARAGRHIPAVPRMRFQAAPEAVQLLWTGSF